MRCNPEVHTVHDPGGIWVNKIAGVPVSRHHTKENAVRRGRLIARRRKTEHAIHNPNGQIGRKNSYGNDPRPPAAPAEKNR
jgi:hypothetical protein